MKISCQSCPAKYTIADEKVLGKIVKIRCKKCGATIVVNGNDMAAGQAGAESDNDSWTVNVNEGDQRTMSLAEIQGELNAGSINGDTFVWRDGMADWLPIVEVPELAGLLGGGASIEPNAPSWAPPPQQDQFSDDSRTEAMHRNGNGGFGTGAPAAAAAAPAGLGGGFGGGFGAPLAGAALAGGAAGGAAAARKGGRGAAGDLFGGLENAGGEDVMSSVPLSSPPGADPKLTGQRNENSVLFSLNALTAKSGPAMSDNRTTAEGDGSGLIDIRALSQTMGASSNQSSAKVDDIMNLSGGGAFGAALAAPVLTAPVLAPAVGSTYPGAEPQKSGGKGLMIAVVVMGGLILLSIIGVGAMFLLGKSAQPPPGPVALNEPAANGAGASGANSGGTGSQPTQAQTPDPTPASTGPAAVAPGAAPANAAPGKPAAGGPVAAGGPAVAAPKTSASAAPAADPPKTPDKPKSLAEALDQSVGGPKTAPPPAAAADAPPFDRGAAAAALSAVNVQSCKKADGPTGPGHVKVTFAPNGTVSSAVADTPPYQGTPVGGCVAAKFRGAKIPAFSGSAQGVGKSFTIN